MAARKNKGTKEKGWPQVTRDRIQSGMLVHCLQSHVVGELDLKPTQVQSALGLLRKTIPDISESKALNINIDGSLSSLSDADLMDAIEHVRQQIAATRQSSLANDAKVIEHVADTAPLQRIDSE